MQNEAYSVGETIRLLFQPNFAAWKMVDFVDEYWNLGMTVAKGFHNIKVKILPSCHQIRCRHVVEPVRKTPVLYDGPEKIRLLISMSGSPKLGTLRNVYEAMERSVASRGSSSTRA
jgi:hypothetical protein